MPLTSLSKKSFDTLDLSCLDETRKNTILDIKNSMELTYESTLNFATVASKHLTDFSSDLLNTMKLKDTPEVEGLMNELLVSLEQVDANTLMEVKPSFFKKLFKVDEIKQFMIRYEDVASVISGVRNKLEDSNYQLKKDMELCETYLTKNMEYIHDLDNYIMAGKLKIAEVEADLKIAEFQLDKSDILAVHEFTNIKSEIERLERKIHDLFLMREIAIQNIPQIRLIRDGDGVLVEKIQSSINSAIPLWESQMVIAIQIMRQKGALAIQKGVTNTTNNLISRNSELLKVGSLEVAKELERGIVDVEVLKKSSENLIKTLEGIKDIRAEGKDARIKAMQELGALQSKLNDTLLLVSGT